ncbi:DUF424 family protein [Candidatus Parvarchaeota archaeon]|nr:DUF424 family protein [Candidatus Parvarchaeota archaeon]
MARFRMRVHDSFSDQKVVAVSDPDLIGRTLRDARKEIEFTVSEEFYGSDEYEAGEVLDFIRHADNINLIGNNIIDAVIKEGIVREENVLVIDGVKHSQIYTIPE